MTNFLVIVADDMRFDHQPYMENVNRLIGKRATTFTSARCNVALCQPSRVGFFSGQLSKFNNELGIGFAGTESKDHSNTVGAWLARAGYDCALIGKYINGVDDYGGIDGAEGWSTWREFAEELSEEEFEIRVGSGRTDRVYGEFSADYLAREAGDFIRRSSGPWFCYVAPKQPHGPFSPHPVDFHAWSEAHCRIVELADVSAKPAWIQAKPPLSAHDRARIQQQFRGRLRELNAVDRMTASIIDAVEQRGQIDDTVIIFTSDNGVHQGDQRRTGDAEKSGPYDVGLRVPLLVAGPGFAPGVEVTVPVYPGQDITATLVDLAGATAGRPNQAGISFRELARDPKSHRDRVLLHETADGIPIHADGITTGPDHPLGYWKLFRSPSKRHPEVGPPFYEMYDLARDPDEVRNVASQPRSRPTRDRLERLLDRELA